MGGDEMRMGYDLLIEQQQKLIMTPELKLALKILQLPAVELEELLQQELENNPVLELVDDSRDEKSEAQQKLDKKEKEKEKEKEIDWKEYFQFQGKSYSEEGFDNDEASELSYENFITYSYTLKDHLISQLRVSQISKKLRDIGEYIIESLDENGYLTITKEDLAAILDAEPEAVEEALSVIQTFEPFGVGASNLKECLLIQLRNKDIKDKVKRINIKIGGEKVDINENQIQLKTQEVQEKRNQILKYAKAMTNIPLDGVVTTSQKSKMMKKYDEEINK